MKKKTKIGLNSPQAPAGDSRIGRFRTMQHSSSTGGRSGSRDGGGSSGSCRSRNWSWGCYCCCYKNSIGSNNNNRKKYNNNFNEKHILIIGYYIMFI